MIVFQASNRPIIETSSGDTKIEVSENVIDDAQFEAANDISPSSDICMEYDNIHNIPEEIDEDVAEADNNNQDDNNDNQEAKDGDSLDEGVGDISSDYDLAESPCQMKNSFPDNLTNISDNTCAKQNANDKNLQSDGEKERRPSRISFETPL